MKRGKPRASWLLVSALVGGLPGCAVLTGGDVVRVVDGQEVRGSYIEPEVYAALLQASALEASGQTAKALIIYERLARAADEPAGLWLRVARARCLLKQTDASQAFAKAADLGADLGALLTEQAKCALVRQQPSSAMTFAKRAVQAAPRSLEATLVLTRALEELGQHDRARRVLMAFAAFQPSREVWRMLLAHGVRHTDPWLTQRARAQLSQASEPGRLAPSQRQTPLNERGEVDHLLLRNELESARYAATRAQLTPGELAARAAALGLEQLAATQAQLVLDADPTDANAWVALLWTSGLDNAQLTWEPQQTVSFGPDPATLTPLAADLFALLLVRHAGSDTARMWIEARPAMVEAAGDDPLARELSYQLTEALRPK